MSDDLPGFIDDDKPTKKAKEPAPPAGGFNPFADVKVDSNPLGLAKTPAPAPAQSATPTKPATGAVAKTPAAKPAPPAAKAQPAGFNAFAGADTAPSEANEADVKPGQGKDLWACPHCDAKNKPERSTCRECGKSPSDPVIIPFHKTPAGRIGIPAGIMVVVLLLGWLLFGGSVKLVPAGPEAVDRSVRRGGAVGAEGQIAGLIFQPKERVAVSGRVLAVGNTSGVATIVLLLGSDALNDDNTTQIGVDFTHNPPRLTPEVRNVALYAFGNVPSVTPGDWLSVAGDGGRLIRDGVYATEFDGGEVIRIDQSSP